MKVKIGIILGIILLLGVIIGFIVYKADKQEDVSFIEDTQTIDNTGEEGEEITSSGVIFGADYLFNEIDLEINNIHRE